MLFGPERLRAIAAGPDGSLEEVPYAVLLTAIAVARRDCVAVVERRRTEKRIVFFAGVPVDCRSNLVNETFGRFLVQQGKLSEQDFSVAFAQSNARGTRLGEVLVERGLLSAEEVARYLQQNLARKLLDGFTWREGKYRLLDDPPPVDDPPKVNVAQLIVTGVSKFAPQNAVDAAVGALVGKRLALAPAPPFPLEEIRLSESQARLAAALAKRPRIDELATAVALPFEEITRLLYALSLLGTVVTADQAPAIATGPAAAAVPAPRPAAPAAARVPASPPRAEPAAPPPARAADAEAAASRAAAISRAFEGFRGKDPFDLLDLPDDADEPAALAKFVERAREWAPWQVEGEAAQQGTQLFAAAARAYARLADPDGRAAARDARRRTVPVPRVAPNVFAIRTDLLDPEAQFRKGMDLLAAGKPSQALTFLEFAADCDPQNGTYAAEASWCRYQISGRTTSAATLAELDEAIRIDPKSGVACFYAGEIHRARGDAERAEPYYRKAAKLMAPDRRPLDALREMARAGAR